MCDGNFDVHQSSQLSTNGDLVFQICLWAYCNCLCVWMSDAVSAGWFPSWALTHSQTAGGEAGGATELYSDMNFFFPLTRRSSPRLTDEIAMRSGTTIVSGSVRHKQSLNLQPLIVHPNYLNMKGSLDLEGWQKKKLRALRSNGLTLRQRTDSPWERGQRGSFAECGLYYSHRLSQTAICQ